MSYFDSPKNNALWEKEIVSLRKEREARKNAAMGKADQVEEVKEKAPQEVQTSAYFRIKTTYKELLAEEVAAVKAKRGAAKTVQKTRNREISNSALE